VNFNPWLAWPGIGTAPFGGAVTQSIAPWTSLFSPQVEVNFAGTPTIEADVVANVASYGRQIGWLTEAVLAIAGSSDAPEVQKLRELNERVQQVKAQHRADAETNAREHLERLRTLDPDAFERLMRSYRT
jgi:hypothetical protein